jgi:hypothetical protein
MGIATAAAIGGVISLAGTAISSNQAKQAAKGAANEAEWKAWQIADLEANRQAIPNPYANVVDLSGTAKDLSGNMTNTFASIGVSTQAAKMQADEADKSLANTLDTLRATGASAGGATALAQAALQSKKGVAASIEKQEADNEKLKAQGAADLQNARIEEQRRIQNAKYQEGVRLQTAESEGIKFKYGEQESRDIAKLNRLAGQQAQAQANAAAAQSAQSNAIGAGIGAIGNIASGAISAFSDRRLKKNINKIGVSNNGINIYSFEYIDEKFGKGLWQGVMSDEIKDEAVIKHEDGFDLVDYSLIDVEFKQL